jgi:hypothetical protein
MYGETHINVRTPEWPVAIAKGFTDIKTIGEEVVYGIILYTEYAECERPVSQQAYY